MSTKVQLAIVAIYVCGILQGAILGVYLKWSIKDTLKFWRGRKSSEGAK